jgi:hypothetical protein
MAIRPRYRGDSALAEQDARLRASRSRPLVSGSAHSPRPSMTCSGPSWKPTPPQRQSITSIHRELAASHRGIQLRPLSEAISGLPTRRQAPTPQARMVYQSRLGPAADGLILERVPLIRGLASTSMANRPAAFANQSEAPPAHTSVTPQVHWQSTSPRPSSQPHRGRRSPQVRRHRGNDSPNPRLLSRAQLSAIVKSPVVSNRGGCLYSRYVSRTGGKPGTA